MRFALSKKIVNKIIQDEIEKTSVPVTVLPLTNVEKIIYTYLCSRQRKNGNEEESSINQLNEIKYKNVRNNPKIFASYNQEEDNIKIYLSDIAKDQTISLSPHYYLLFLLQITYHEYHHKLYYHNAKQNKSNSLDKLIFTIESLVQELPKQNTKIYLHYNIEIQANVYSVEKAKIFLQKYPNIYKKIQNYLETLTLLFKIRLINYDLEQFINYLHKVYQQDSSVIPPNHPLNFLYNEDKKYKPIQELEQDNFWNSLENPAKYTILSSKSYLQALDYNTLNKQELTFIKEALQYSLQKEKDKKKQNENIKNYIFRNVSIMQYLEYLINSLIEKEHRNRLKIKYLEYQLKVVKSLLQDPCYNKKYVRNKRT